MRLTELLSEERVAVRHVDATHPLDKPKTLRILAEMLAHGARAEVSAVERVLTEREQLQSTGIEGVDFAAIDGLSVTLLFAVITPKRATGEHLKTLARVSRLLRNKAFRDRLVTVASPKEAYALISNEEGDR
jgi:PTS system nitrogen regulatory IIA component